MNERSPRPVLHQAMAALLLAAAWACYLPLGMKYATVLGSIVCAVFVLQQQPRTCLQQAPGLLPSGILLGWLALTALWTPASGLTVATHIGRYGLLLLVPLLACTCPPAMARRGLQHFVLVSALVGALLVLARMDLLPQSPWLWHTSVNAEGNQRIANSILLALGACLALWHLLHPGRKSRWAWALAGSLCMAGLAFQDRRTGMLLLPVLLLAWALARQPDWKRRLAGTAVIVVAAIATWQLSEGVRGRFAEGLTELQQFTSDDRVTTSWGQRLRMWEWTITMVQERPLVGHGVGSWQILWRQRVMPGTALADNTTPHNEYLLLAEQGGVVAVALWAWLLLAGLRHAWRAGAAGVPSVMAWTALAWAGLFNATLRDAKFALPLLLLAALSVAARRDSKPQIP